LFEARSKAKVKEVVDSGKPFMYTSGRYGSEYLHTTAAVLLGRHAEQDYALVYDLRQDPSPFLDMSVDELIGAWKYSKDPDKLRLPVKTLKYNRCPAVVPGVVKDKDTLERLKLSLTEVEKHLRLVSQRQDFVDRLFKAVQKMDEARERSQMAILDNQLTVDERLYDGFIDNADRATMVKVRGTEPSELSGLADAFKDARLKNLLPLYKARNFPKSLGSDEQKAWDDFVTKKLLGGGQESRAAKYFAMLAELAAGKITDKQRFLLEELQLYGQSIVPTDEAFDAAG
jgi:exodeoxyribonuclease-1